MGPRSLAVHAPRSREHPPRDPCAARARLAAPRDRSAADRKRRASPHTPLVSPVLTAALALLTATLATALDMGDGKGTLDVRKGFRFSTVDVTGNRQAYLVENPTLTFDELSAGSKIEQTLQVNVDCEVVPKLYLQGSFDDAMFPAKRQLDVRYEGSSLKLNAGDIVASFAGVEFPMESQNLFGVKSSSRLGEGQLSAVAARTSGAVGHWEGRGDRTRGPYFLPDRHLIPGTDRVTVDGRRLVRGGEYTIDGVTGVLTFTEPVDDRFQIVADYEYESVFSMNGESLTAARFATGLGAEAAVGVTAGRRGGGLDPTRALGGLDGRFDLPGNAQVTGEIAQGGSATGRGVALRMEGGMQVQRVSLGGETRLVSSDFQGLGSVGPIKDQAIHSVHASYTTTNDFSLTGRVQDTYDNLARDPARTRISDVVTEGGARYLLKANHRVELTLDSRLEDRSDDRAVHQVDTANQSLRAGTRYRLDHHMLLGSLEVRTSEDRASVIPSDTRTILASVGSQSHLPRELFVQTGLTVGQTTGDGPMAAGDGHDIQVSVDGNRPFQHVQAQTGFTTGWHEGATPSVSHSALCGLSSRDLKGIHAEINYQLKETQTESAPPIGDSVITLRASHQEAGGLNLTGDLTRRLSGAMGGGPLALQVKGDYRFRKQWEVSGGLKLDQLENATQPGTAYKGRMVWSSATMVF